MFDFVAKHKRLLQLVLALTMVPFVFFGLESYTRSAGSAGDAAVVDGAPVSMREFTDAQRQQQERLRQMLGQNADLAQFDTPEMRLAILESLVAQRLITNEVVSERLSLSREEVVAAILAAPEFQAGGKFSKELYEGYLRTVGLSDEGNVMKLRTDIPASRLTAAIAGSAIVPRAVVARLTALEEEKREVAEAFLPSSAYLAQVRPDEAAVKAYYEAHLADFRVAERVRAEYAVLSAQQLAQGESATEAEIKTAYEARAAQLGLPEQRRASHILLATKDEAEKLLAEARAAPQRFADIAKKHSQDSGSAANGGDLGMNPRGALASKELEEAVFRMKPGEAGELVQTEFGFHIVRVTAIQAGKSRSLDEVRAELAAEIAKQKAAKKFAEAAEAFNNLVYEQSDSLKPAADRYQLKIATTGWFTRQGSPEIGPLAHPKLLAALFSGDATRQRRNTDAVEVAPGVLVAARVAEHQPEAQRPFEEVKAEVAQRLARREAAALAKRDGEAKLAALAKGGEAGLAWAAAKLVSRKDPQGLARPAIGRVMAADAAKLPAYAGAERGDEGYALYRISKIVPAAPKEGPQADEHLARFERQAGGEQLEAYVASLRARAKVELRRANLEKN